jgi:hypothetical protein
MSNTQAILDESRVYALVDFLEKTHTESPRSFLDAFADIEDAHLPLETYLRRARINARRYLMGLTEEQREALWAGGSL